ncbi:hypothetical protein L7F22_067714 [Adiantum nelumboides]|nr:hypothetical protein [Adiantum nelumboides]
MHEKIINVLITKKVATILTYCMHEKIINALNVKSLPPPPVKLLSNSYTLFFVSAFRRAIGKARGGLFLVNPKREIVAREQVILEESTSNNEAEYDVLIIVLKMCLAQGIQQLMVKGDALLIVKQVLGIWACKNEMFRSKVTVIHKLCGQFQEVQLYHIPRKENEDANLLAQQAIIGQNEVQVIIAVATMKEPQYAGMESLAPIVNYILEEEFPKEFSSAQRRRLIKKGSTFLWLEGALYQKSKDLVCRRVPCTSEIPEIQREEEEKLLVATLKEYKDVFAWSYKDLKGVDPSICQHTIPLQSDAKPNRQRPYTYSEMFAKKIKEEIDKVKKVEFIYEIEHTDWVSPIVVVPKKNGKLRVCINLKKVNAATVRDNYRLPITDHVIERVVGRETYIFLDGFLGYNQLASKLEDQHR